MLWLKSPLFGVIVFLGGLGALSSADATEKCARLTRTAWLGEQFKNFESFYKDSRYENFRAKLRLQFPHWRSTQARDYDQALSDDLNTQLIEQRAIKRAILKASPESRMEYLRGLSREELILHSGLLDAFFGLDVERMDQRIQVELATDGRFDREKIRRHYGNEEIWLAPGAGQQTPWTQILEAIDQMELQSGQTVADLGSGLGRLGLMIGLLKPDVRFVGIELVQARVDEANSAATQNDFKNVSFVAKNLADESLPFPDAGSEWRWYL